MVVERGVRPIDARKYASIEGSRIHVLTLPPQKKALPSSVPTPEMYAPREAYVPKPKEKTHRQRWKVLAHPDINGNLIVNTDW